jgi:hypothetical protein
MQLRDDESSPSDNDDNDDLFPEDHGDNNLIKIPAAPLGNGGHALRPQFVVAGYRPGEEESPLLGAGEKSFIKDIAPVAPLDVGRGQWTSGIGPRTKDPRVGPLRRRLKCLIKRVYDQSLRLQRP